MECSHIEIQFNIPRVDQETFSQYCDDLQEVARSLRQAGLTVLRPYSSETTLEIIVGAIAGITVYEFVKAFFNKLGQHAAERVAKLVDRYSQRGVSEVVIEGRTSFKDSSQDIEFTFKLRARDAKGMRLQVEKMIQMIDHEPGSLRGTQKEECPEVSIVRQSREI